MNELIHSLRGMPDVLPEQTAKWHFFEQAWRSLMQQYAYQEIRLPILEKTALFKRSIGEVTDIVEKEMFTFSDRDGESISLRPEGTASCVRACLEHGLLHNQVQKLWYAGPMFRYERPQKGRYRQFYQVGVEAFGLPGADIEAEHFLLMHRLWKMLGIDHLLTLQVNNLGSSAVRHVYRAELIRYLETQEHRLDADAKKRLHSNPLRILDSKNPDLQSIIQQAPQLIDYLDEESRTQFDALRALLESLEIPYEINPRLVRGLDYYNGTVYEWVTDALGAQGTVCAGGRYDGLVEQLGGRTTPGVGFAMGVERLLLLRDSVPSPSESGPSAYLVHQGADSLKAAFKLAEALRNAFPTLKLTVHLGGGSLKNQFKKADKSGAHCALILAEDEMATQTVSVKWLRGQTTENQRSLPQSTCAQWLMNNLEGVR